MKRFAVYLLFLFPYPVIIGAANYGSYNQLAEINFENGSSEDALNNVSPALLNGAGVVFDSERNGKVLEFSADSKGCLQLSNSMLSDTLTISFWGKRTDENSSGLWRMFLALYANDGSNIYLTPLTSWGANSFLVVDNKPYASYKSLAGKHVNDKQWHHFVVAFFDNCIRYYVDGEIQIEMISLFRLSDFRFTKCFFGCNPELNYPMSGQIDDLKIFHSALYTNQIQALFEGKELPEPVEHEPTPTIPIDVTVNTSIQHQTIQNFGASDGWNAQTIGLYFPEDKKKRIAEILFSRDTLPNGTPHGIGLSAWRFNIGAGTTEQGEGSRISHYSRRTECFLNPDKTTYNWGKQAGQRWFLEKAAKTYEVKDIIGWQNSPPVHYTVRNLGFREYGDAKNSILKKEHYNDFGDFLANVVNHFREEGIHIKYISPLNEPQWDWSASATGAFVSQEGTPWVNQEISEVVKAINTAFVKKGVTSKQFITEAGSISHLLNDGTGYYAKQLYTFWDPSAPLSVAGLPSLSNYVASHSYWTDATAGDIVGKRNELRDQIKALNPTLEYWQTEYCLLGNGYKFGHANSASRTLSPMECGISLARIIHNDLTEADASGWQWWTTFEFDSQAGTEERFALIRFELNPAKNDGIYRPTKLLYTLGQFSYFIRPGMKRISCGRNDGVSSVEAVTGQMFSAYADEERVVIVAVNASPEAKSIRLNVDGLPEGYRIACFTPYMTSSEFEDNMKPCLAVEAGSDYLLSGTSVTSFVGKLESNSLNIPQTSALSFVSFSWLSDKRVLVSSERLIDTIVLCDLSGRIAKQIEVEEKKQCEMSVDELNKGLYIMTVYFDSDKEVCKLLIR